MAAVTLNALDSNLSVDLSASRLIATPLSFAGFGLLWSGTRATTGIVSGKYYFRVKVLAKLNTSVPKDIEGPEGEAGITHACRIGVSTSSVDLSQLGETHESYGYGSTGKKSNAGKFTAYGPEFGPGDTVCCLVDLSSKPGKIAFTHNTTALGAAFDVFATEGHHQPLFPHLLLKNMSAQIDFGASPQTGTPAMQQSNGHSPWQVSNVSVSWHAASMHATDINYAAFSPVLLASM